MALSHGWLWCKRFINILPYSVIATAQEKKKEQSGVQKGRKQTRAPLPLEAEQRQQRGAAVPVPGWGAQLRWAPGGSGWMLGAGDLTPLEVEKHQPNTPR